MDADTRTTADEVIALLELEPLPDEGGQFRQIRVDENSTAIYFLMQPGDFSALHRLTGPEMWHHYAGAPVDMLLLAPDGSASRPTLGDDLHEGQRPFVAVEADVWMGASTTGEWSLVGTTMAPPYDPDGFELGSGDELAAAYPEDADRIAELVRRDPS